MSLYTIHNGQIVDAYTGRVVNLSQEEERQDWKSECEPAMNRIVGLILLESERQIASWHCRS